MAFPSKDKSSAPTLPALITRRSSASIVFSEGPERVYASVGLPSAVMEIQHSSRALRRTVKPPSAFFTAGITTAAVEPGCGVHGWEASGRAAEVGVASPVLARE